jgi:hypothetical protein
MKKNETIESFFYMLFKQEPKIKGFWIGNGCFSQ